MICRVFTLAVLAGFVCVFFTTAEAELNNPCPANLTGFIVNKITVFCTDGNCACKEKDNCTCNFCPCLNRCVPQQPQCPCQIKPAPCNPNPCQKPCNGGSNSVYLPTFAPSSQIGPVYLPTLAPAYATTPNSYVVQPQDHQNGYVVQPDNQYQTGPVVLPYVVNSNQQPWNLNQPQYPTNPNQPQYHTNPNNHPQYNTYPNQPQYPNGPQYPQNPNSYGVAPPNVPGYQVPSTQQGGYQVQPQPPPVYPFVPPTIPTYQVPATTTTQPSPPPKPARFPPRSSQVSRTNAKSISYDEKRVPTIDVELREGRIVRPRAEYKAEKPTTSSAAGASLGLVSGIALVGMALLCL